MIANIPNHTRLVNALNYMAALSERGDVGEIYNYIYKDPEFLKMFVDVLHEQKHPLVHCERCGGYSKEPMQTVGDSLDCPDCAEGDEIERSQLTRGGDVIW